MNKSIFISCVHEDSYLVQNIERWARQGFLGNVVITSETEDKRNQGREAVRQYLINKIRAANVIIVLVGRDTHNHDWIEVEVELANSLVKPVICIRIPNTTGALPKILSRYSAIAFDPTVLKKEIMRLMP